MAKSNLKYDRETLFLAMLLKYGSAAEAWGERTPEQLEWMRSCYGDKWRQRFGFAGLYELCLAFDDYLHPRGRK